MVRLALTNIKPVYIRSLYVLIVLATLPFLIWNGFTQQVSAGWNDVIMRMRGVQASPALGQIVLVAIDDRTAAGYGPLPLNRAKLAEGLEVLAEAHPRVAVLDLLISEAGDPAQDSRLVRAIHLFPGPCWGRLWKVMPASALAGSCRCLGWHRAGPSAMFTRRPMRMARCAPSCS